LSGQSIADYVVTQREQGNGSHGSANNAGEPQVVTVEVQRGDDIKIFKDGVKLNVGDKFKKVARWNNAAADAAAR
jgi:hypothetical protein